MSPRALRPAPYVVVGFFRRRRVVGSLRLIDLHAHTVVSDGTLSPADLVALASKVGLAALAVTDHDHVGGLAEARAEGAKRGVEIVTGIELSVAHGWEEVHMLGYLFDDESERLLSRLERLRTTRDNRNALIVQRLQRLGLKITMEDVEREAQGGIPAPTGAERRGQPGDAVRPQAHGGSVGRPHIARVLLAAGAVASVQEAFDKYLADGRPAFVPRERLHARDAIGLLHDAGGRAVLAHPGLLKAPLGALRELAALGLDGVEVWHPKNPTALRAELTTLASTLGLVVTGGSDFHGENKPDVTLGIERVEYGVLEALRRRARS